MATKNGSKRNPTVATSSKLARRKARRDGSGSSLQAEYEAINHEVLAKLIDAVVSHGGTVTFGTTKDGGAYYLNYWCDGTSDKVYIRPNEDPDNKFLGELEFWLED